MSTHPLNASFSVEERDRLLHTIAFSIAPREYHLHSAEFPSMAHIVNYSLLYEALSESQRSKFVPSSELKNGDILQLTDYRECDTYFCLWLTKDLFPQDLTKYLQELENSHDDASEGNAPAEERTHSYTSLPLDFQVGFMPKPVPLEASTDSFPHRLPRDDPRVGQDDGALHLYVFSHLDEYGFGGTTATSMAYPEYFQAIKTENASFLMLDPLLVHSQSYYGQLVRWFQKEHAEYQANPCFPVDYIARIDQLTPATWHAETHSFDASELRTHWRNITWIPIDMAATVLATGGCASSTVTTEVLQTLAQWREDSPDHLTELVGPIHSLNVFYEIRNVLYQHFRALSHQRSHAPSESLPLPLPLPSPSLSLSLSPSPSPPPLPLPLQLPLPLYNEEYIRFPHRLQKFFITSTATIDGDPFAHDASSSSPSYYVERPYEAFVRRYGHRYRSEILAELDAADPSHASSAISSDPRERVQRSNALYNATSKRAKAAWATVSEEEKQAVQAIIATQQEEAAVVDRDLSAYRIYRQAERAALWTAWVAAATPAMTHHYRSWFQSELFLLQSWMHLSETERAPYRHRQAEEEARAQIRHDADGILRTLRLGKFQHRIYAGVPEVVAVEVEVGVEPPDFVLPPSSFTFTRCHRSQTMTSAFPVTAGFASVSPVASPYRPPPGFIAFVFDNHRDLARQEYSLDDDGLAEMARRWWSLVVSTDTVAGQETMHRLLAREAELETIGHAQSAVRQQQRAAHQAKGRQA